VIEIRRSPAADTRTCEYANVTKQTLLDSSNQHIDDVRKGLELFIQLLQEAQRYHDFDKLEKIDQFHADFVGGFKSTKWWDQHRRVNRHHLGQPDGVPGDVHLVDVIEYITDCVMAGMARSGEVRSVEISVDVLLEAFDNTVALLKSQVVVIDDEEDENKQPSREEIDRFLKAFREFVLQRENDYPDIESADLGELLYALESGSEGREMALNDWQKFGTVLIDKLGMSREEAADLFGQVARGEVDVPELPKPVE
jgi:hypothetical protein